MTCSLTCTTELQSALGYIGDELVVLMASIAKNNFAETEADSHRTTAATLVLEEIGAVLGTHLRKP